MYNSQDVANRIKQRAKFTGTTMKTMLAELDLGINMISHIAKGQEVSYVNFAKIADYLGCSVDYLLGRTDNPDVNANGNCISVDNNVQAIKSNGDVTIRQITSGHKIGDFEEIEAMIEKLPRPEQLRAVADMMDLLEEKYSE
jgi:transcriptional regulator with XRE-family HTH domain